MSDTPDTLDGPSGPSPEGSVALPAPKKPWRAPQVIASATADQTLKYHSSHETTTPTSHIYLFGPS